MASRRLESLRASFVNIVRPHSKGIIMKVAGIAVAVALVGALASGAAMADGNALLHHCQSALPDLDGNDKNGPDYSEGYCTGVINSVMALQGLTNPSLPKTQTCMPKPAIQVGQAARIVVKYMTENPDKLNLDDGVLVLIALQRAYPCK